MNTAPGETNVAITQLSPMKVFPSGHLFFLIDFGLRKKHEEISAHRLLENNMNLGVKGAP